MKKNLFFVALPIVASIILAGALSHSGQAVTDFSGKWQVRWLSNDSRNPMSLNQASGNLTGTYINDAKDHCSVSGEFAAATRQVMLRIVCLKWNIEMEGYASLDGKLIVGKYVAYGNAVGGFTMIKK
jgi:hypothetical protein